MTTDSESYEVPGGPPQGGPPFVLDPGGRIRTSISLMDSESLYQLRYPGVVPEVYASCGAAARCLNWAGHFAAEAAAGFADGLRGILEAGRLAKL